MKRIPLVISAVLGLVFPLLCSPAHAAPVTGAATTATLATPAVPADVLRAAEELRAKHQAVSASSTLAFRRSGSSRTTQNPSFAAGIVCTATAQYPHRSTGTPSAVDGKASSHCTAPIPDIRAQGDLYRYLDGYGFSLVGPGSLAYKLNSAGPVVSYGLDLCQGRPTYYILKGTHKYTAPPGFSPPSVTLNTATPPILVDC